MGGADDEIPSALGRIERLLEALVRLEISELLEKEISKPKMAELYAMTGHHSVRVIRKKVHMAMGTISDIWRRWEQIGLLYKDGRTYKKVVD